MDDALAPVSGLGHRKFVSESFLGCVVCRKDLDGQHKIPGQHAHWKSWGEALIPRVLALRNADAWSTSELHPISEPQIRYRGEIGCVVGYESQVEV